MKSKLFFIAFLVVISFSTTAREGMWIPMLLDKNIEEMQKMGFRLTANDVYNVNNASMKDAVCQFAGGCTAELISEQGLIITNHHCGYSAIQSHSSLKNDYLTDGFWAMSRNEELPNKGLTVTFLVEMREVTNAVLAGITSTTPTSESDKIVEKNRKSIIDSINKNTKYEASIKPFFNGNQYFLFINQTFRDVRLVGAPPSAIGKFGGDTDNWMWPRHTGDFSLFRIYADSLNQPASYSPNNVPYKPKKFFPISLKGVSPEDFTMVFGYPGTTNEYLPSPAIELLITQRNPNRIALRDIKLDFMRQKMEADAEIRIKYAAKYASVSNSWKKWQGELKGLNRLNALQVKKTFEQSFSEWATKNEKSRYTAIFTKFETVYAEIAPLQKSLDYYSEAVFSTDIARLASKYQNFSKTLNASESKSDYSNQNQTYLDDYFRNIDPQLDEEIVVKLLKVVADSVSDKYLPKSFIELFSSKSAEQKLATMYHKSPLSNKNKLSEILADTTGKLFNSKLKRDKLFKLLTELQSYYTLNIQPNINRLNAEIDSLQKIYMAGILEMNTNKQLYPDANSTLRVSYGKVEGFEPADGIQYKHYTTLDGIIAKDNPDIYDYRVPLKLKELHKEKDYGRYATSTNELPVCFTASNHTTGGNSGSPVIDATGNLIGINFDRCWEGTMSDIMFDPEKCRNIALDIRYALFIIDKFAGAGYLLEEMKLVE